MKRLRKIWNDADKVGKVMLGFGGFFFSSIACCVLILIITLTPDTSDEEVAKPTVTLVVFEDQTTEASDEPTATEQPISDEQPTEKSAECVNPTHTVKEGETLAMIAAQYDYSLEELIIANQWLDPSFDYSIITVEQDIVIPKCGIPDATIAPVVSVPDSDTAPTEESSSPTQVPEVPQPTVTVEPPTAKPPTAEPPTPMPVCDCSGNTLNCGDFSTQGGAQACYAYCWSVTGKDVHGLDGDGDGFACDN